MTEENGVHSGQAVCRFDGCGAMAVWDMAPCDSFGEWCDDHVPRGCSCNVIGYPETDAGEEERDDRGRLLPCCEYDFEPDGFVAGDPDGPRKYREALRKAQADANSPPVSPAGYDDGAAGGMNHD